MPTQSITAEEYQQFLAERERIKAAMNDAESEFMFQTYRALHRVLNKRYELATRLNVKLENREINTRAEEKRKSFQAREG
jgi:hypothetical protein